MHLDGSFVVSACMGKQDLNKMARGNLMWGRAFSTGAAGGDRSVGLLGHCQGLDHRVVPQ